MTTNQGEQFDNLKITDVRIIDAASLPPTYFLRESVLEQLRREVRKDVMSHHKPMPPGAEAVFTGGKLQATFNGHRVLVSPRRVSWRHSKWGLLILAIITAAIGISITIIFGGK